MTELLPLPDDPEALQAEVLRLRKVVTALIRRAEKSTTTLESAESGFTLYHTAALLEDHVRERTLDLQGRRPEQRADLDCLAAVADALDDDTRRAELALRNSLLSGRVGDYAAQQRHAAEALALATRADDAARGLNARRLFADARVRQGDLAAGEPMVREGLAEARARGWQDLESRFLNALAVIAGRRQDVVAMLEASREATALRGALGDRRNQATGLVTEGIGWLELGELERADECLQQGLQLQRAIGDHVTVPIALANLSQLALWRGDAALACSQGREAVEAAVSAQSADLEVLALWTLGNALLEDPVGPGLSAGVPAAVPGAQRLAQARTAFGRALELASASGSPLRFDALAGQARAALAAGDLALAQRAAATLLAHLDQGGGFDGAAAQALVDWTCHLVLAAAGDARATALLERAHQALVERAGALGDPGRRQTFLERVPVHRALVGAWLSRTAG